MIGSPHVAASDSDQLPEPENSSPISLAMLPVDVAAVDGRVDDADDHERRP
jgi:hypothetical protein